MSATVTCQQCRQSFSAAPDLYGKTVPCPGCGAALTIPDAGVPLTTAQYLASSSQRSSLPPQSAHRPASRKRASKKALIIIFCSVFGGTALFLLCAGFVVVTAVRSLSRPPQTEYANLLEGRSGFTTTLTRREQAGYPLPAPPPSLFLMEWYRSPAGELAAYVSPPPGDGKKHAAMIWVFGGFDNSIGETAWEPASPDNDQSASAFRKAGIIMMYPSFRGGNMNPGHIEAFYGEVDDLMAAADHLANKDYVDPQRIYLGGHSTGGTLVMLTAAATDRFRAVFAFGPVDNVAGYGPDVLPFNPWKDRELSLRNPGQWLHAMGSPVFVFEGTRGNISCLRSMQRTSTNPQLRFHEVRGADHFSILAPMTGLLAEKILQDTGSTCSIQLTDEEIDRRFRSTR
jgi:hypothetical protein